MNSRLIKILVTLAVVVGGIVTIVYSSESDVEYYKMVDELMAEPEPWVERTLQVHGFVKAGSIDERIEAQQMVRTFVIENKGKQIIVHNKGPKPDTFKDLSEVVARGRLVRDGDAYVLHADKLMAKCPSKYEGAEGNRNLGKEQTVF